MSNPTFVFIALFPCAHSAPYFVMTAHLADVCQLLPNVYPLPDRFTKVRYGKRGSVNELPTKPIEPLIFKLEKAFVNRFEELFIGNIVTDSYGREETEAVSVLEVFTSVVTEICFNHVTIVISIRDTSGNTLIASRQRA